MFRSEEVRKLAPEMDPLRLGMGWKLSDLDKPKIDVYKRQVCIWARRSSVTT